MKASDKRKIVKAAIQAPSGDNMQPWSFAWKGELLKCYLHQSRSTAVFDVSGIAPLLSAGAVLENIHHAGIELGYHCRIDTSCLDDDSEQFASIGFEELADDSSRIHLTDSIFKRSTNRFPYRKKPLSSELLNELFGSLSHNNVFCRHSTDRDKIKASAKIFMQIDRIRNSNRRMHEDLFKKITFGDKAFHVQEGLAEQSLGVSKHEARLLKMLGSWKIMAPLVKLGKADFSIALKIKQLNETAPVFAVVTVKSKSPSAILEAGRAMQHLWLKSCALKLDFQPITVLPYLEDLSEPYLNLKDQQTVKSCSKELAKLWDFDTDDNMVFALRVGYAVRGTCIANRRTVASFYSSDKHIKDNSWEYDEAFSRHCGIITDSEQEVLRRTRVAIPGMGGVGGIHLLTLLRLGIERFNIADFDFYELANINRQVGAGFATIGQQKAEVMKRKALEINPEADIQVFSNGITKDNLSEFLGNADLLVDGLDFQAIDLRREAFRMARELGIWGITAGPIGAGTAWLSFDPNGIEFDKYFDLSDNMTSDEKLIAFSMGLHPKPMHFKYIDLESAVNVAEGKFGSLGLGCNLASGVAATEIIKILLNREGLKAAPYCHQFDAYSGKAINHHLRWGNRSLVRRLARKWFLKQFLKKNKVSDSV